MIEHKRNGHVLEMVVHSDAPPTPHKRRIDSIQGLRAVAISAVLLFHLWPKRIPSGFLGVDIFFVISGYLMCLLLSRRLPIDWPKVSDFYFRRLKRIVPTYLFVIFIVLTAALVFVCPIDYADLYNESIKPLFFASNIPSSTNNDYFNQHMGSYTFLLHLWSLAVEIQFYLFVPLIVFITEKLTLQRQILFVSTLALISFLFQITSSRDAEHMALSSRVWQFMYGFLAYYLQESQLLDFQTYFYRLGNGKYGRLNKFLIVFNRFLNFQITISLLILISYPVFHQKQLNRLLVIVCTTLLIARPDSNPILSAAPMVWLGDISYSVYLIHWPLFEWYRYYDVETFVYDGTFSLCSGITLIVISIVLGYAIEEIFKRVKIPNWRKLLEVIGVGYVLLFLALASLKFYSLDLMPRGDRLPVPHDINRILYEIGDVWKNHKNPQPLPTATAIQYNGDFYRYSRGPTICRYRHRIPSNFKDVLTFPRSYSCIDIGSGTKNIVIIGNSHANSYYPGVQQMFKDVYRFLTLVFLNGCQLVGLDRNNRNYHLCRAHRDAIIPMLQNWRHPIDVLIVGQAYITHTDPAIIPNDPLFVEMQLFYTELSKIARDVVFIPQVQVQSAVMPHLQILQRRIYNEESLDMFRTSLSYQYNFKPNTRKRIAAVRCPRCLIVEFEDLWCNKEMNYCDTINTESRVSYFFDQYHPNIYGSLLVGEYLRQIYDGFELEQKERQNRAVRELFAKLMRAKEQSF
ncbi:hypothetical protein M3Y98_01053400 [Aphelenchoides besseyi]|nr:hypothetical protein M3Y98_01053400 [Aphelenchoides besseyi]KAI6209775.1 hypothetical protein M3Y96_00256400 [Aphelenchoides besseyi]